MRRPFTIAVTALLALAGCEKPRAAPCSTTSLPSPAELVQRFGLHDPVSTPIVAESERNAACPRILSAAPNITEICCALGLGDALVGRTAYCAYPPAIVDIPSIGDLAGVNAELLLKLHPELTLIAGESRVIADRLAGLRIPNESLPDVSLEDLFMSIERAGALTNRPKTARRLTETIRADLERVAAEYAEQPRRRVLLLIGPMPDPPAQVWAAGPGSYHDDLLRLAGHKNIVPFGLQPFTPVSLEFILENDPEVVVELDMGGNTRSRGDADTLTTWAKVGPIRAVRDQRVHVIRGQQHLVLGPRVAQTLAALCETITPTEDE